VGDDPVIIPVVKGPFRHVSDSKLRSEVADIIAEEFKRVFGKEPKIDRAGVVPYKNLGVMAVLSGIVPKYPKGSWA